MSKLPQSKRFGRAAIATSVAAGLVVSGLMSSSIGTANAAGPKTGGTLILLEHTPKLDHLDPSRIYTGRDLAFENSFFIRTLVAYNPVPGAAGAGLVADLATNTGVPSNEAKTWTFTLRPGTTFEDGKAITCADVKYGVSRVFAADIITDGPGYLQQWLDLGKVEYKGPYAKDAAGQAAFDKAVTCSANNRTITFNLNKSVADFNYLGTYGVISPVQAKLDKGDAYDLRPQATGPYKIAENTTNQLKLVRNPKWNKASDSIRTPYPDEVVMKFGLDEQVMDQVFLNDTMFNAVNFDGPLPANKDAFFQDDKFKDRRINTNDPYSRYLAFNIKKMPCLEIRQAMYYARNAKAILDYAGGTFFGGSYSTGSISPLLGLDYEPTKVVGPGSADFVATGNVAKAQALMDKAKTSCPADYKHATVDGIVIDISQSVTLQDTIPINTAAWARVGLKVSYNIIKSGYYSTVLNPAK
ncbi:MAG: ABC transporter substrate-binding protein, partial [Actinomycetes bacterium]